MSGIADVKINASLVLFEITCKTLYDVPFSLEWLIRISDHRLRNLRKITAYLTESILSPHVTERANTDLIFVKATSE